MKSVLVSFLLTLRTAVRSRAELQLEVLALRHQLQVLQRTRPRRVRLAKTDRWLWVVLSRIWTGWRTALVVVKPETVIAWHRQGFRLWWTWKSRRRMGRPTVPADVRTLIRTMSQGTRVGAPRGFMANCGNSGSTSVRRLSRNIWCARASLLRRPGAPSCGITSAKLWQPISSWSQLR